MKRYEACLLLTQLAQNELVGMVKCKELLKARDIVVCGENTILDVLATQVTRDATQRDLIQFLFHLSGLWWIDNDIAKRCRILWRDLQDESSDFYGACDEKYLDTRCDGCPNYKGCKE